MHTRKPADYKEDTVSSKTPERCKPQQARWRREVRSGNENRIIWSSIFEIAEVSFFFLYCLLGCFVCLAADKIFSSMLKIWLAEVREARLVTGLKKKIFLRSSFCRYPDIRWLPLSLSKHVFKLLFWIISLVEYVINFFLGKFDLCQYLKTMVYSFHPIFLFIESEETSPCFLKH